jgi:hypothetical protein
MQVRRKLTLLLSPSEIFCKYPYNKKHDSRNYSNDLDDVQLPLILEFISNTERELRDLPRLKQF